MPHRPASEQPVSTNLNRTIFILALPALGALLAEPLFVLADTAIIGRLGTSELAGLSLAATALMTVVGLCIFLAYATTAMVGRLLGAGDTHAAYRSGIGGLWLAAGLGALLALGLSLGAPQIIHLLGADATTAPHAISYLRWSAPGLPGMLLVLAATGVLRGKQDTRTPLVVAAVGLFANVVLNYVLVYPCGLGIAGSGLGSSLCQLTMGGYLARRVLQYAREAGVSWRPQPSGITHNIRLGFPLLLRSVSLRLAILLTVWVATAQGETSLAAHQVVTSLWNLAAFILDALAIAAQALISNALGAGLQARVRAILNRCLWWGVVAGAGIGLVFLGAGTWFSGLFSPDPQVIEVTRNALVIAGIAMPLAGWVFVLDGVLIGAGDGNYLARAGIWTLVAYLPVAWGIHLYAPDAGAGLTLLWVGFAGYFMAARALATGWRALRHEQWLHN